MPPTEKATNRDKDGFRRPFDDAEPHTIAKHVILRKYLAGWMPTLSSWNKRLIFIDGFAGPRGVRKRASTGAWRPPRASPTSSSVSQLAPG
jgi:hypothetical protein